MNGRTRVELGTKTKKLITIIVKRTETNKRFNKWGGGNPYLSNSTIIRDTVGKYIGKIDKQNVDRYMRCKS